ncbi:adenylate cyclase [Breoghania corrubedonensis]|uniref:Adenylate cyclase n=1 Tax=Breoghania corrubedonensis TaxID=665038 RepID=A0A2T5V6Q8_9HYPH|nr:adenylate/guanylate cyclase domain-containing protein [Breoghania corrubedonensis]PTW59430.1 adenylate cyclase [Breoghania corrubedonensis]
MTANDVKPRKTLDGLEDWLIREARLFDSPADIVDGVCRWLIDAGLPLIRCRIGQRLADPLMSAWGVVWRPDHVEDYVVDRETLEGPAYFGSPFQAVVQTRAPRRYDLTALSPDDHESLHEQAEIGGRDYIAIPFIYGDGSVQGGAFVFSEKLDEATAERIMSLRHALAATLEPVAMRRSARSLLTTYLGRGPAERVMSGAFRRGDMGHLDAVVLFTDLCGSSALSERCSEAQLLSILDTYFEAVADGVKANRGEVLKFLGDGLLAIFPVDGSVNAAIACGQAVAAVNAADAVLRDVALAPSCGGVFPCFAAALHLGPVVYGNIGSRDRLDFTVVGQTVNLVSRLEDIAKSQPGSIVCSQAFAQTWGGPSEALGTRMLKGFSLPQSLHTIERHNLRRS